MLIRCRCRPGKCSLMSSRLIAFLQCALFARLHVGQPRAQRVRAYLSTLSSG